MSDISALQSKFNDLIEEQRKLNEKFQKDAQDIFRKTLRAFFEKNPGINALVWTQYTPYFNDGDTCEFSVNDVSFTNATSEDDLNQINYDEYDGENEDIWVASNLSHVFDNANKNWYKETVEKIKAGPPIDLQSCDFISEMIPSADMEDVLEAMFGDHVKVIATREGFDVQEHEHD